MRSRQVKEPSGKEESLVDKPGNQNSSLPHQLSASFAPTEEKIQPIGGISPESQDPTSRVKGMRHESLFHHILHPKPSSAAHDMVTHQVTSSPINNIPVEILELILVASSRNVPDETRENYKPYPTNSLPWTLCQVSHLWRRTALSLSSLWSQLPTIDLGDKKTRGPKFLSLLAEVLKRSHNAPVDVYLHSSLLFSVPHPIFDLLFPHSPRWRQVRIELPLPALLFFGGLKGKLPGLQAIVVHTRYHGRVATYTDSVFEFLQDAPRLQKVAIYGPTQARFLLPSAQRTRTQTGHGILSSPTLTSLTILGLESKGISWPMNVLPQLVVMKIRFQPRTPSRSFLNSIVVPSLEEFQLVSDVEISLFSISSMISRSQSSSKLKRLFVRSRERTSGQLVDLLWQTPLITHLNINLPSIEDISALTETASGFTVAPLLQICEFFVTEPLSADMRDQLNLFAASRSDVHSKSRHADSQELRHMQAIYIEFNTLGISELEQREFQDWPNSMLATTLTQLKQRLIPHIPEVFDMSIPSSSKNRLKLCWNRKASTVLSSIATLDISQATDIYISGLHQIMHRLSSWYPPGHPKHKLCTSASRVLEKWAPAFKSSLKDFRWAIKDMNTLLYISQSNPIRDSAQAVKIVFEVKDLDISPLDLPWPPKGLRL